MGVALVRRGIAAILLAGVALVTTGADAQEKLAAFEDMAETFDQILTAMTYAAAGLCLFAIVWAGFMLMAEGGEGRDGGGARTAVIMAVVGLVLVLSAKAVVTLLLGGLVSFQSP